MILTMEGTMYPSYEDEFGFGIISEPTHSDDDETFYCESILSGEYDENEADREGFYTTDEQFSESDLDFFADRECDRWERSFWGD